MDNIDSQMVLLLREIGIDENNFDMAQRIIIISLIVIMAYMADLICRKLFIPGIKKITARTQIKWDDYLFNDNVLNNCCHLITPIILYIFLPLAFPNQPGMLSILLKLCWIYIIVVSVKLVCSFLTSLYTISSEHEKLKNHPLKGVYQMIKLIVICVGAIIIIANLIDKSPLSILTGLGASAAIIMLVFRDSIIGLVSGVQLAANHMLRAGDWISMPKYGVDGVVEEVTLTTVKVRNWDNTIVTVPPYALVSDSFQNWRGMQHSNGRRIKRSINIDMNTVHFCNEDEIRRYIKRGWLKNYEENSDIVNLGVFREYMEEYLRNNKKINSDMVLMVRQLQPTPEGLPIELYFFSLNKEWIPYEKLQAEIFDYLLAILPEFGLKVFQSPTGKDIISLR